MKLSEVIEALRDIKKDYGDLELVMPHVTEPVVPVRNFEHWTYEPYGNGAIMVSADDAKYYAS